jgi:hypothetical protein
MKRLATNIKNRLMKTKFNLSPAFSHFLSIILPKYYHIADTEAVRTKKTLIDQ